MANNTTSNPLVIDTAAPTNVTTKLLRVKAIVWDPGASAANLDNLTVKDANGKVKFSQTIYTGTLVPPPFVPASPITCDGLAVTALTHGTAYIYLADSNNL